MEMPAKKKPTKTSPTMVMVMVIRKVLLAMSRKTDLGPVCRALLEAVKACPRQVVNDMHDMHAQGGTTPMEGLVYAEVLAMWATHSGPTFLRAGNGIDAVAAVAALAMVLRHCIHSGCVRVVSAVHRAMDVMPKGTALQVVHATGEAALVKASLQVGGNVCCNAMCCKSMRSRI